MIRFDNVTKTYRGNSRPGLSGVDFEILRGEFVFLVGPSGSGKSTCLRLVLREDVATSGRVVVLGRDTATLPNRKVPFFRRHVGSVFQDFRLLQSKTVFQNVAFTLQVTGSSRGFIHQAVPEALALVGLSGKEKRLPHELSGGEQQRVAIARAIVNRPQVLLADEPTGNLDPATSIEIMQLFARINAGGTTVVMATHEAAFVDQMKRRVIQLADGEIVRDELRSGYGDTSQLPRLEPERARGVDSIAALTAVLELQQRIASGTNADPAEVPHAAAVPVDPVAVAGAPGDQGSAAAPLASGADPVDADDADGDAEVAASATRATERWTQTAGDVDGAPAAEESAPTAQTEPPASTPRRLTGPIEIELPDLPEVGVADRLGLNEDPDDVGPTT